MNKLTRLYIVRHGETEFNTQMRIQGWCDSPLTQSGVDIAAKLGAGLRDIDFDMAYSSDLKRAVKSAEIILNSAGKDIELIIDENLRERGLGSIEGTVAGKEPWDKALAKAEADGYSGKLDIEELARLYDLAANNDGSTEPLSIFSKRLFEALNKISSNARDGVSNVLVISHGLAILGMIYAITGCKYVPLFIKNASVTLIEYEDGKFEIKKVNDLSYVQGV